MKTLMTLLLLVLASNAFAGASSTATGISRSMNPAISLNGLFLARWNNDNQSVEENFVKLQEAEIQFSSIVDPFWAADVVLAVHPAHVHADGSADHGMVTDLELAALRSTTMPAGLGLTLGKFYLPFGRHAALHTHQQPFTTAPIAQLLILGDHGLTEVGALVDWTAPLPWWSELQVYGVNGDAELFNTADREPAFGARWSNLWELGDEATVELGGSYLTGSAAPIGGLNGRVDVYGADLTWKWVSAGRAKGPAAEVSAELLLPEVERGRGDPLGWFVHAQTRLSRDWWLGAGYGRAQDVAPPEEEKMAGLTTWREWRVALTFAPSEYSALRLEGARLEELDGGPKDFRLSAQMNFTIGSHPAHNY
jgi:hypothetical protein